MPDFSGKEHINGSIEISYLRSDGCTDAKVYTYPLFEDYTKDDNQRITCVFNGENGKFAFKVEQYQVFCDYDEYYICYADAVGW